MNDAKTSWSHRVLAFANGDSDDRFASVSNFIVMLCFHAGCRQLHLGFRMDEMAFKVSGLIALSTAFFTHSKPIVGNHAAMEALLLLSVPVTNARAQRSMEASALLIQQFIDQRGRKGRMQRLSRKSYGYEFT